MWRGLGKGTHRGGGGTGELVVNLGQGIAGFLEGQSQRCCGSSEEGRAPGATRVCVVGEKIPLLPTDPRWG